MGFMEGSVAIGAVGDLIATAMDTVTKITANPLVAAAIAVPLTGSIIVLVRKLFKRA